MGQYSRRLYVLVSGDSLEALWILSWHIPKSQMDGPPLDWVDNYYCDYTEKLAIVVGFLMQI